MGYPVLVTHHRPCPALGPGAVDVGEVVQDDPGDVGGDGDAGGRARVAEMRWLRALMEYMSALVCRLSVAVLGSGSGVWRLSGRARVG